MNRSARLYNCARCHCQVVICRHCDRGNIYCVEGCADEARTETLRRAGNRYRASKPGRMANAERQRRYRQRQREKVTHQGSPPPKDDDVLPTELNRLRKGERETGNPSTKAIHCHFCRQECHPFLRHNFLRPPFRSRQRD